MNEETIIKNGSVNNGRNESKKESFAWKQVTLGGVSGILMGAGAMFAANTNAATVEEPQEPERPIDLAPEQTTPEQDVTEQSVNQIANTGIRIAETHDNLSFGEAFAAARAEVGAGGVFHWHGGIYNTYTAEEWNAMSQAQKNDFAQRVQPEIDANQVSTPTDDNTFVIVEHHVHHHYHHTPDHVSHQQEPDVVQLIEEKIVQNFNISDDAHIVGYGDTEGHLTVGYDMDGDGQADVAIIDVDDNYQISDADVIIDREGNMVEVGELNVESDPNVLMSMENPEVAPDMPDYTNDADLIEV